MAKKNVPYTVVDGIPNEVADAALLGMVPVENFHRILQGETILLAKAKLNLVKVRKKQYEKKELISKIAPHLQKEYSLYNSLAIIPVNLKGGLIDNDILEGHSVEEWIGLLQESIEEEPDFLFGVFNEIRFRDNGVLHYLAKPLLEYYSDVFEEQTGMKLGPVFERKEINMAIKKQKESSGAVLEEKFKGVRQLLSEIEETAKFFDEEEISRLRNGLEEEKSNYKQLKKEYGVLERKLTSAEKKLANSEAVLAETKSELRAKEKALTALTKKHNELSKSSSTFESQNEQLKKEAGKLGLTLGELRKKTEELEKQNNQYAKKISSIEQSLATVEEDVKKNLELHYRTTMAAAKDDYENQIYDLGGRLNSREKMLQEVHEQNQTLEEKVKNLEEELRVQQERIASEYQESGAKDSNVNSGITNPYIMKLVRELVRQELKTTKGRENPEIFPGDSASVEAATAKQEKDQEEDGFSFLKDLIDIRPD